MTKDNFSSKVHKDEAERISFSICFCSLVAYVCSLMLVFMSTLVSNNSVDYKPDLMPVKTCLNSLVSLRHCCLNVAFLLLPGVRVLVHIFSKASQSKVLYFVSSVDIV